MILKSRQEARQRQKKMCQKMLGYFSIIAAILVPHRSHAIVAQLAGEAWSDVAQGMSLEATLELGTNDVRFFSDRSFGSDIVQIYGAHTVC